MSGTRSDVALPVASYRPEKDRLTRPVKVLLVQNGPATPDKRRNVTNMVQWMRAGLDGFAADFVVFSELSTTMYFCGTNDPSWMEQAEPIPGPTTETFSRLAAEYGVNVILPIYERGPRASEFHNSAVLLDRHGEIIPGVLPDGTKVNSYRKTHLPHYSTGQISTNEKYFFRPGPGLPIFKTDIGAVGCLICYDRSFPEAWRVLSLSGAEIVFVPAASAPTRRAGTFVAELQTAAVQNGVFVVAVNKGGPEVLEAERLFFGMSCVIHPESTLLAQCPAHEGPVLLRAEFDLDDRAEYAGKYYYARDRRPELYGMVSRMV